jgi:uncharacterized protein (UPF0332 family)
MKEYALSQWQRAVRTLASARQLLETDPDSAASRAYYAAFHSVTALFALRGQAFSKHSAVRAALHRELIRSGQWTAELGRAYDFLMDMRETGDYGGLVQVSKDDAEMSIEKAESVIKAVKTICPELGA